MKAGKWPSGQPRSFSPTYSGKASAEDFVKSTVSYVVFAPHLEPLNFPHPEVFVAANPAVTMTCDGRARWPTAPPPFPSFPAAGWGQPALPGLL